MIGGVSGASKRAGSVREFFRKRNGWQRFFISLVAGLLSALSFAPYGIFPLLLCAYAVLVLLMDAAQLSPHRVRNSAIVGWAFGFGQFFAGLYWVGYAFLVDPAMHAWQLPLVAAALPGGLALYPALACAVAARFWRPGTAGILIFSVAFTISEWLRGHALSGFPWNLPAYGWGASLAVLQSTAVFGSYGLSFLTILFGSSLASLFNWRSLGRLVLPLVCFGLFAGLWIGGALRLNETVVGNVPNVRLRLVQPNVAQKDKYDPLLREAHWRELMELSLAKDGAFNPTHIIWPEAAPPFLLQRQPQALDDIAVLTGTDRVLMTGNVRAIFSPNEDTRAFNSFFVFARGGDLVATYDKSHLVPFGEYLPFPKLLGALGLTKVVNTPGSFESGPGPRTIAVPSAPPMGPLICYEVIFPGEVTSADRPAWFVNVTDDSWFGPPSSSGPYQHLLIAQVRAIEEGIPIARDANTGISAVIDPLGRIVKRLGAGLLGVIDSPLPENLPATIFAKMGVFLFLLMLIVAAAAGFLLPED